MKNGFIVLWMVAASASILIFTGCGIAQAPQATPLVPNGSYTKMLDFSALGSTKFLEAEMKLANGTYQIDVLGGVYQTGGYAVTKDLFVFVGDPTRGDSPCFEGQEVGVYKWSFDGKQLTLTEISEPCLLRKRAMLENLWVKK